MRKISPNTHRCQRVFCPIFLSYLHGTSSLAVSRRPTLHSATDQPIALWKLEQIQPRQMPAEFLAVTSRINSLSSVLLFFQIETSRVTFDDT
jgi:hypothetical protein